MCRICGKGSVLGEKGVFRPFWGYLGSFWVILCYRGKIGRFRGKMGILGVFLGVVRGVRFVTVQSMIPYNQGCTRRLQGGLQNM